MPTPELTPEAQAALDANKSAMANIVQNALAEYKPDISAQLTAAIAEIDVVSQADFTERMDKVRDAAFAAINDLDARMKDERGRRWDNSEYRFRFQYNLM